MGWRGTARPLRAGSTTAAATALVVLLTGYADDGSMLLARLADTFIGISVGLVVNLAVWPPLRDRRAARRIDDHEAGADVRSARESGRLNFRREAARRVRDARDLGDVLLGIEQAVAETRSMVRTMGRAGAPSRWQAPFRDAWFPLLSSVGRAVGEADASALRRARTELERLADSLSAHDRPGAPRPAQGAFVVNLHDIVEAMTPVAAVQPVRVRSRGEVAA